MLSNNMTFSLTALSALIGDARRQFDVDTAMLLAQKATVSGVLRHASLEQALSQLPNKAPWGDVRKHAAAVFLAKYTHRILANGEWVVVNIPQLDKRVSDFLQGEHELFLVQTQLVQFVALAHADGMTVDAFIKAHSNPVRIAAVPEVVVTIAGNAAMRIAVGGKAVDLPPSTTLKEALKVAQNQVIIVDAQGKTYGGKGNDCNMSVLSKLGFTLAHGAGFQALCQDPTAMLPLLYSPSENRVTAIDDVLNSAWYCRTAKVAIERPFTKMFHDRGYVWYRNADSKHGFICRDLLSAVGDNKFVVEWAADGRSFTTTATATNVATRVQKLGEREFAIQTNVLVVKLPAHLEGKTCTELETLSSNGDEVASIAMALAVGNVYVSEEIHQKYGTMRIVNDAEGIKGVTSPLSTVPALLSRLASYPTRGACIVAGLGSIKNAAGLALSMGATVSGDEVLGHAWEDVAGGMQVAVVRNTLVYPTAYTVADLYQFPDLEDRDSLARADYFIALNRDNLNGTNSAKQTKVQLILSQIDVNGGKFDTIHRACEALVKSGELVETRHTANLNGQMLQCVMSSYGSAVTETLLQGIRFKKTHKEVVARLQEMMTAEIPAGTPEVDVTTQLLPLVNHLLGNVHKNPGDVVSSFIKTNAYLDFVQPIINLIGDAKFVAICFGAHKVIMPILTSDFDGLKTIEKEGVQDLEGVQWGSLLHYLIQELVKLLAYVNIDYKTVFVNGRREEIVTFANDWETRQGSVTTATVLATQLKQYSFELLGKQLSRVEVDGASFMMAVDFNLRGNEIYILNPAKYGYKAGMDVVVAKSPTDKLNSVYGAKLVSNTNPRFTFADRTCSGKTVYVSLEAFLEHMNDADGDRLTVMFFRPGTVSGGLLACNYVRPSMADNNGAGKIAIETYAQGELSKLYSFPEVVQLNTITVEDWNNSVAASRLSKDKVAKYTNLGSRTILLKEEILEAIDKHPKLACVLPSVRQVLVTAVTHLLPYATQSEGMSAIKHKGKEVQLMRNLGSKSVRDLLPKGDLINPDGTPTVLGQPIVEGFVNQLCNTLDSNGNVLTWELAYLAHVAPTLEKYYKRQVSLSDLRAIKLDGKAMSQYSLKGVATAEQAAVAMVGQALDNDVNTHDWIKTQLEGHMPSHAITDELVATLVVAANVVANSRATSQEAFMLKTYFPKGDLPSVYEAFQSADIVDMPDSWQAMLVAAILA